MEHNYTANDLWDALGEIPEEEAIHVLTKLFATYEQQLQNDPQSQEVHHFFQKLQNALQKCGNSSIPAKF